MAATEPPAWILTAASLPNSLAKASQAERLDHLRASAQPKDSRWRASVLPLSWRDDMLIMVEFIFWMLCLLAPPCAAAATVVGLCRRWLLVAACGAAVLFSCCERISGDCWPNQMSDSSATRFLRYISLRVIYEDERFYSDRPCLYPMVPASSRRRSSAS
jgi:hypothetical protein